MVLYHSVRHNSYSSNQNKNKKYMQIILRSLYTKRLHATPELCQKSTSLPLDPICQYT